MPSSRDGFRRIVVVRPGALGDLILAAPLVERLRRSYPGTPLHLVADRRHGPLFRAAGLCDEVHAFGGAPLAPLFSDTPIPRKGGPAWAREALVLWLARDPSDSIGRRLCEAGARHVIIHPPEPRDEETRHVAVHLLDVPEVPGFSLATDLEHRSDPSTVAPFAHLRPSGSREATGRLLLHPGSGGRQKIPSLPTLAGALARALEHPREDGRTRTARVLLGPVEDLQTQRITEAFSEIRWETPLVFERPGEDILTLLQVLASNADSLYVGCDSGVSHLAGQMGFRCLILFGPTSPRVWRPWGPSVRVLGGAEQGGFPSLREVAEALDESW